MADTKISNFTDGITLNNNDVIPVARSGANYKLSLTGIGAYGTDPSSAGKFVRFSGDSFISLNELSSPVLYSNEISLDESGSGPTARILFFDGDYPVYLTVDPATITQSRTIYLPDKDGYISIEESDGSLTHAAYKYNYKHYVYNSGDLSLSSTHNGKTIVSTNTTGIVYTVASGLSTGYSCSIVQYGTGLVSFTGAAGISVNSYGGLTSIAGQYGSAYINWMQNNSYLLAGNLA